ncbi:MAG TPA: DNA internalization-related competence protein ComEC/Rec2 [Nitrospira sp.]|nr:DNA internalization-related competence protein ComEC/Rec2 [Nitrospira sp.]
MLPFLTLAFIGGLALGSLIPYYPVTVSASLCLLMAALSLLEVRARMAVVSATASLGCLLCGMLYWFLAVEGGSKAPFHGPDPETFQSCTGRVIAPVQYSPGRMLMIVRCEADAGGRSLVLRLTWRAADRRIFQGDRIAVRAKLRAPSGSLNPGGFNYAAYLEHQGIDAVATVNGIEAVEILESGSDAIRWSIWNRVDHWRDAIRLAALRSLEPPAVGLFLGVVIGERGYLDPDLRDQFMITGTVHLLSISGSHLGLVAMLSFAVIRQGCLWLPASWLLRLSRRITATRLAAAVTLFPASVYACLAGAEVATVRSLVMVLVALAAKWLGYEQRIFHALAAAALAIVLHDPQVIYDISFQLSFLSVCAVGWRLSQAPRVDEEAVEPPSRVARAGRWGIEALVMSAVVTITTAPLVAFYFNQVSWLGLVTNLAAVPLMGGLLVPLGLLAALWKGREDAAGLPFAAVIQWSMDGFVSVLGSISQFPGSEWHLAAPALPSLVLFYACLGRLLVGYQQLRLRRVTGMILLLLFGWWMWSPRLWLDGERFRMTFLDVAQGDSAVLELPGGEVVLIDGGGSYERFDMGRGVVAPYLWNRGIRTIDYVIATHPQLDHVGGLAYVLRHFNVRHFWGTGDVRDEAFYHRLQEALAARGLSEHVARRRQDVIALDGCRLDVLNPPLETPVHHAAGGRNREGRMLNNRSIVTALTCGRHRMLFTADVEEDALLRMSTGEEAVAADLVKVPHHGAASSLQPEWLARANPRYAVISVGRHNAYGHPADGVLRAYAARGVAMYRTDVDGGIWVTGQRSAPGLQLHRTSDQQPQRVPFPRCLWACERLNWERLIDRWRE